eukprot:GHVH01008341.1.p1 GENE.GHVH01008341.1~~GHVH01008341.1.p1  ORF type:complete len:139 (+),score=21.72 GHVH01008341.1:76-492(+)
MMANVEDDQREECVADRRNRYFHLIEDTCNPTALMKDLQSVISRSRVEMAKFKHAGQIDGTKWPCGGVIALKVPVNVMANASVSVGIDIQAEYITICAISRKRTSTSIVDPRFPGDSKRDISSLAFWLVIGAVTVSSV